MNDCTRINSNMLEQVISARWVKKQFQHWPTADAQWNALRAAGVDCSYSSVCNWRQGLLPKFETMMKIALAGWVGLVTYVQAPAMQPGELAALRREIDERSKALNERRRELDARLAALDRVDFEGGGASHDEA